MYTSSRPFSDYAKVANRLCLVYKGVSPEHVIQLDLVRKAIPDMEVGLSVPDRFRYLVTETVQADGYGHVVEFKTDPTRHMVLDFIRDAKLTFPPAPPTASRVCLICPTAVHPVKSFTDSQLESAKKMAIQKRLEPVMARSIEDVATSGWVIGPENEYVFSARDRATLVGSGPGAELYRLMFPNGEIRERI